MSDTIEVDITEFKVYTEKVAYIYLYFINKYKVLGHLFWAFCGRKIAVGILNVCAMVIRA